MIPRLSTKGALEINKHPGVSHNYAREGSYYNLWFTLAVPPDHDLETTVQVMAQKTKAQNVRIMPTIRFFKIGVNFDMVKQKGSSFNYSPDSYGAGGYDKEAAKSWNQAQTVTEEEKEIIRGMQEDLPLVSRPFDPIADKLGMTTAQLFQRAADFQERRLMRRYSAVLHHRRSGFRANAMIVWKVPAERSEEVGMTMAQHNAVDPLLRTPHLPGTGPIPTSRWSMPPMPKDARRLRRKSPPQPASRTGCSSTAPGNIKRPGSAILSTTTKNTGRWKPPRPGRRASPAHCRAPASM